MSNFCFTAHIVILPFVKKQFDPFKLIFLVGYLYRSVILHHRKNIETWGGIPSFFLIWSFFWNSLYFFYLNFVIFCYFFFRHKNSKVINLKLRTLKLSELQPVSYKRYFRCNNCFQLHYPSITEYKFSRPATDAYHLYETPVTSMSF